MQPEKGCHCKNSVKVGFSQCPIYSVSPKKRTDLKAYSVNFIT
jgi:hypothetical protein